jgi:hypothetical protein
MQIKQKLFSFCKINFFYISFTKIRRAVKPGNKLIPKYKKKHRNGRFLKVGEFISAFTCIKTDIS